MSLGPEAYHSANPAATPSSPRVVFRSTPVAVTRATPVAVTRATATDIDVSSVHSPGSKLNGPPPEVPWCFSASLVIAMIFAALRLRAEVR